MTILLLMMIFFPSALYAQLFLTTKFPTNEKYKTINTAHFNIHFPESLKQYGYKLSIISEEVHFVLSEYENINPDSIIPDSIIPEMLKLTKKTEIILIDVTDNANGQATPFPENGILLYLTRPEQDSYLSSYDDWLKILFIHEYTHILNFDKVSEIPYLIKIFTRIYFPNALQPLWIVEGYPVYNESRMTGGGRLNNNYSEMILRVDFLSGNEKSIMNASNNFRDWPYNRTAYLYGAFFIEYLDMNYGEGTFTQIQYVNANNIVPYQNNKNANEVFQRSFTDLWQDWIKDTKEKYEQQLTELKSKGLTIAENLTNTGVWNKLPVFSQDGKFIYYYSSNNLSKPKINKMRLDNKTVENDYAANNPFSISIYNKNIYTTDVEINKGYYEYHDLYKIEKHNKRLTSGERILYSDVNSGKVLYITNSSNSYRLFLSDIKNPVSDRKIIINNTISQLSFCKLSSGAEKAVLSFKDPDGKTGILLINTITGETTILIKNNSNNIFPSFTPDGGKIILSSDITGIYNLYEIDLSLIQIRRLTNLVGGAFSSCVSPDGKTIVYSGYNEKGFDIYSIAYPVQEFSRMRIFPVKTNTEYFKADSYIADETIIKDYQPLNYLNKPYWHPIGSIGEVYSGKYDYILGLAFFSFDTLHHHIYSLKVTNSFLQKKINLLLSYTYSTMYPDFTIEYYDENLFYLEDEFPWNYKGKVDVNIYRELRRSGALIMTLPYRKYNYSASLIPSIAAENLKTDKYIPLTKEVSQTSENIFHSTLQLNFKNTKKFSRTVEQQDGIIIQLTGDNYNIAGSVLDNYNKIRAMSSYYSPLLPYNSIFTINGRAGSIIQKSDYELPYSIGRYANKYIGLINTGDQLMGLRGYPAGYYFYKGIAAASAEINIPIVQKDIGVDMLPFLFRSIWAKPFIDIGKGWAYHSETEMLKSAGIEIHSEYTIGYYLDIAGFIGCSYGFDTNGETQIYFGAASLIEGGL